MAKPCGGCQLTFLDENELKDHRRELHPDAFTRVGYCAFCARGFEDLFRFYEHLIEVHPERWKDLGAKLDEACGIRLVDLPSYLLLVEKAYRKNRSECAETTVRLLESIIQDFKAALAVEAIEDGKQEEAPVQPEVEQIEEEVDRPAIDAGNMSDADSDDGHRLRIVEEEEAEATLPIETVKIASTIETETVDDVIVKVSADQITPAVAPTEVAGTAPSWINSLFQALLTDKLILGQTLEVIESDDTRPVDALPVEPPTLDGPTQAICTPSLEENAVKDHKETPIVVNSDTVVPATPTLLLTPPADAVAPRLDSVLRLEIPSTEVPMELDGATRKRSLIAQATPPSTPVALGRSGGGFEELELARKKPRSVLESHFAAHVAPLLSPPRPPRVEIIEPPSVDSSIGLAKDGGIGSREVFNHVEARIKKDEDDFGHDQPQLTPAAQACMKAWEAKLENPAAMEQTPLLLTPDSSHFSDCTHSFHEDKKKRESVSPTPSLSDSMCSTGFSNEVSIPTMMNPQGRAASADTWAVLRTDGKQQQQRGVTAYKAGSSITLAQCYNRLLLEPTQPPIAHHAEAVRVRAVQQPPKEAEKTQPDQQQQQQQPALQQTTPQEQGGHEATHPSHQVPPRPLSRAAGVPKEQSALSPTPPTQQPAQLGQEEQQSVVQQQQLQPAQLPPTQQQLDRGAQEPAQPLTPTPTVNAYRFLKALDALCDRRLVQLLTPAMSADEKEEHRMLLHNMPIYDQKCDEFCKNDAPAICPLCPMLITGKAGKKGQHRSMNHYNLHYSCLQIKDLGNLETALENFVGVKLGHNSRDPRECPRCNAAYHGRQGLLMHFDKCRLAEGEFKRIISEYKELKALDAVVIDDSLDHYINTLK